MKYICPICNGRGCYEIEGDLHKSSGIVPCQHCYRGYLTKKEAEKFREWGHIVKEENDDARFLTKDEQKIFHTALLKSAKIVKKT